VEVHTARLFCPFPESFGPTLVQEKDRQATAVQFLTVREVATRLRVSPATVYALCAAGSLPHTRISNSLRIALKDFEAFVGASVSSDAHLFESRRPRNWSA
jgi:excisionase family DNA binding protein